MQRKIPESLWVELVAFYHEGHSYDQCAVYFGVSKSSIAKYFKAHPEIPRRKALEPANNEARRALIAATKPQSGEKAPPAGVSGRQRKIVPLKEN